MPAMTVLRIVADESKQHACVSGRYISHFEPDGFDGRGIVSLTSDRHDALRFANAYEAMSAWRSQSRTHPLRPDGEPNRPLTAFSVTFEIVEV